MYNWGAANKFAHDIIGDLTQLDRRWGSDRKIEGRFEML
jgi:hypothetical protein